MAETRQIPEVLTTAIRTALTGRPGPVFVEIPVDLLMTHGRGPARAHPHRLRRTGARSAADPDDVAAARRSCSPRAERPVVMAGSGVYWDDAAEDARAPSPSARACPSS